MAGMFSGGLKTFLSVDIDIPGMEKFDELRKKLGMTNQAAEGANQGVNRMGQSMSDAGDSAEKTGGQFGKTFGILMNTMFLGMAMSQVFGRLSRKMLDLFGTTKVASAAFTSILLPFFSKVAPIVNKFLLSLMDLPKSVKMAIGALVGLLSVLGPILFFGSQIALLATSGLSLGMVASAAATLAPIIAGLAAAGAVAFTVYDRFPKVFDFIAKILKTSVMNTVKSVILVFKGLMNMLQGFVTFLLGTVIGVLTGDWDRAIKGMKETFKGFVQIMDGLLGELDDIIADVGRSIYNTLVSMIPDWMINLLEKGLSVGSSMLSSAGNILNVNDFILTSGGKMIKPHKDDTIIGTKTPGQLGGGGGEVTVNINDPVMKEDVDVRSVVDEVEERVNRDTRGRTGLGT